MQRSAPLNGALPQRPGWQMAAACRGLDTELFFPARGESVSEAKAICAECPVRIDCAEYAFDSGQRFGIWGGATERERRRRRAARRSEESAA